MVLWCSTQHIHYWLMRISWDILFFSLKFYRMDKILIWEGQNHRKKGLINHQSYQECLLSQLNFNSKLEFPVLCVVLTCRNELVTHYGTAAGLFKQISCYYCKESMCYNGISGLCMALVLLWIKTVKLFLRNLTSPFRLFHGILRESISEGSPFSNRKENGNTFFWTAESLTLWAKSWCNSSFITGRSLW